MKHILSPESLLNPVFFEPRDTLGLIFPASPIPKSKLKKGLGLLESFGFGFRHPSAPLKEAGYLAGSDEERLAGIAEAFNCREAKGVLAARGGYGCLRLLPKIDWSAFPAKPLIGYSDLTAFHLSRLAHTGQGGWHAPVVSSYTFFEPKARKEIVDVLMGRGPGKWHFHKRDVLREGEARGPLIGGNLTLIDSLLGTGHLPSLKGAILMIEDIDEQNYRLDRQLTVLGLSGRLRDIGGLVFGEFVNCGVKEAIKKLLASFVDNCLPRV
ncbi:MAG: LD-carboxypeptidase, partial [Deltaproteobacteria bacterium]|nr:LD-carboxypeptidase [Deltaproteobacteria bacterium]